MKVKRKTLNKPYGFIDYHYSIEEKYPHGILIFMGSYVNVDFRGQHKFSEMVHELFSMFPKGTEVHVPVANKMLVKFFEKLGFNEAVHIEHWGNPSNATCMIGFIKEAG